MLFVSLTRARLRSVRFLPGFAFYGFRSNLQVQRAPGFRAGALLPERHLTFWTMTAWESREHMLAYMLAGPHRQAMPHMMNWCDEASVAHWEQESSTLPTWAEADHRMRSTGRATKLHHPSPAHAALAYAAPRTAGGGPIYPRA